MNARVFLVVLSFVLAADVPAAESDRYLDAVRTFADNRENTNRSNYQVKQTPKHTYPPVSVRVLTGISH